MTDSTHTLIVGAGQAGLALSSFLTAAGHEHVLLERARLGERWRSERWDSLTLLSPNWLNRLPGGPAHADPEGFLDRDGFLGYLERYAASFDAPVLEGAAVTSVRRAGCGFRVESSAGGWLARNVVVAIGDSDVPRVPFPAPAGVETLHASAYRAPDALPAGAVLVVGAGASGLQLAAELARAGRDVVLSAGAHSRAPRRYRGRDIFEWLDLLGDLDRTVDELPDLAAAMRVPSFSLSGANGGETLDLNAVRDLGVAVAGRLVRLDAVRAHFADDLGAAVAKAEDRLGKLLRRIDAHPAAAGTPEERVAAVALPAPPASVALRGVGAVVWATGYGRSYPWLRVPGALGPDGELAHRRGVTRVPGLYALGLRFQYTRKSHFIGGVGEDAAFLASRLVAGPRRSRAPRPLPRAVLT